MISSRDAVINLVGFPENEAEDIRRCLATLYSIREGEQPLDRELGLRMDYLDKPANIARNLFALEVIEKTKKYEPRVEIERVTYEFSGNGMMRPVILVRKGSGIE